jgi:hypothetical protein
MTNDKKIGRENLSKVQGGKGAVRASPTKASSGRAAGSRAKGTSISSKRR